jgi:hypothetical protein
MRYGRIQTTISLMDSSPEIKAPETLTRSSFTSGTHFLAVQHIGWEAPPIQCNSPCFAINACKVTYLRAQIHIKQSINIKNHLA